MFSASTMRCLQSIRDFFLEVLYSRHRDRTFYCAMFKDISSWERGSFLLFSFFPREFSPCVGQMEGFEDLHSNCILVLLDQIVDL